MKILLLRCLRRAICLLLLVCILSVVFLSNQPSPVKAQSGFVQRSGAQFMLNGQPFTFGGSNNYYVMYSPQNMVDELLQNAVDMRLRVLRVMAFIDIGSLPDTTVKKQIL